MLMTAALCLAMNVYMESRGESIVGQHAVAQVTLNRAERDPSKVCDEVFKRRQFSWTNGLDVRKTPAGYVLPAKLAPKESAAWDRAKKIAAVSLKRAGQPDVFAHGAKFYHATYVYPSWRVQMTMVTRIGRHKFYTA